MAQPDIVGVAVRDMAASLRFYRLLGLDIPSHNDAEGHVEYVTVGGFRIAWDTLDIIKSFDPDWAEPSGHRMTLGFKCESAAEVDRLYAQVIQHGYGSHKAPWDAFWGQRYAIVIDPDGNHVDLFAGL
jgi:uncharacterized glyoxalase superfamily protein PhnB